MRQENDSFYRRAIQSKRWQDLRRAVIADHPLCALCSEEGFITPATEVHHRRPVSEGVSLMDKEQLMFDPLNLEALCHRCHVRRHVEMGRSGRSAQQRINAARSSEFILRKME